MTISRGAHVVRDVYVNVITITTIVIFKSGAIIILEDSVALETVAQ